MSERKRTRRSPDPSNEGLTDLPAALRLSKIGVMSEMVQVPFPSRVVRSSAESRETQLKVELRGGQAYINRQSRMENGNPG